MGILDAPPARHGGARSHRKHDPASRIHTCGILTNLPLSQTPVYTLIETPQVPTLQSKLFLTDDPALIVLYSQLRQKTLQTLRGAVKVTPKVEWSFVLHNARLYDRMGCDLLGLGLVRNWEFLLQQQDDDNKAGGAAASFGGDVVDPGKLLKRRSSLVVQDMPLSAGGRFGAAASAAAKETKETKKPPPTMFEEPDAGSLLDSFGF